MNMKRPGTNAHAAGDSKVGRFHQPTPRECALLVLHLIRAKESETHREVTRARLTELTLRRLWNVTRITADHVAEVQELLLHAGWTLFWARSSYAIIATKAVEGWARISSKRIEDDLIEVSRGAYDFNQLEPLLLRAEQADAEDAEDS
jgi:hypothetical protein